MKKSHLNIKNTHDNSFIEGEVHLHWLFKMGEARARLKSMEWLVARGGCPAKHMECLRVVSSSRTRIQLPTCLEEFQKWKSSFVNRLLVLICSKSMSTFPARKAVGLVRERMFRPSLKSRQPDYRVWCSSSFKELLAPTQLKESIA